METADPVEEYKKRGIDVTKEQLDEQTAQAIKDLGGSTHSVAELSVEVPTRLISKPQFHGMVIPYTASVDATGKPVFAIVDEMKRWTCARDHLCGVCGEELKYWNYFLGGPRSCVTAMFIDPPMHEECVVYSLTVCPYLKNAPGHITTLPENLDKVIKQGEKRLGEGNIHSYDVVQEGRPTVMGVYVTRGYKFGLFRRSILDKPNYVFQARTPARIEWYEGVKGNA